MNIITKLLKKNCVMIVFLFFTSHGMDIYRLIKEIEDPLYCEFLIKSRKKAIALKKRKKSFSERENRFTRFLMDENIFWGYEKHVFSRELFLNKDI